MSGKGTSQQREEAENPSVQRSKPPSKCKNALYNAHTSQIPGKPALPRTKPGRAVSLPVPHTQLQEAPGESHGLGQVPLLIDSIAQVVQDVNFVCRGHFSLIQLLQGLLHPQLCVVVVSLCVGNLPQLKAIFSC